MLCVNIFFSQPIPYLEYVKDKLKFLIIIIDDDFLLNQKPFQNTIQKRSLELHNKLSVQIIARKLNEKF